jgi:5-methylcytosine-specific restriction endonuclease McrA
MTFKNPYTAVIIAARDKYNAEDTDINRVGIKLDELPKYHVTTPDGLHKTWGPWSLEVWDCKGTAHYGLYHEAMDYEIDFDTINCTADVYDWISHMSAKNARLYGDSCVYFLCKAFEDMCNHSKINLRTTNADFKGTKIAAKYYKSIQQKRNISVRLRHQILERDSFKCRDCGATSTTGATLEVDHTVPVSKGGSNDPSNLRTLCSDCNRGKAARIVNYPDANTDVQTT